MPVKMVESFPFCENRDRDGKTESEEEERKEPVGRSWIKGFEIQKAAQCQNAYERKVILVFRMEIELERRDREGEKEGVPVSPPREYVRENPDDREIRKHGSGIRPNRAEFAELADSRKAVEYGDRLQKHQSEG